MLYYIVQIESRHFLMCMNKRHRARFDKMWNSTNYSALDYSNILTNNSFMMKLYKD